MIKLVTLSYRCLCDANQTKVRAEILTILTMLTVIFFHPIACTVVNKSGMADNCKLACCQEDLCNNGAGPSSKTVEESTPVADQNCNTTLTSAVHGLAASFGAIFSAFHVVLTVFVVFN